MRMPRYLIMRRVTQVLLLLLFWLGAHTSIMWFSGNYSASTLFGVIPLADPFALLQILATGHLPASRLLLGAGLLVVLYLILGGRVFCSWVCPVNIVADAAAWTRRKLGIRSKYTFSRNLRYGALVLSLILSTLLGVAAFEWISPVGISHRELIFSAGYSLWVLPGIFLFDLLLFKDGWCGHLCPLGAAYGLLGRFSLTRVRFRSERCDRCGDCKQVCPETQVLDFKAMEETGLVLSGECTNCGRCLEVCPTETFTFSHRFNRIKATTKLGEHS